MLKMFCDIFDEKLKKAKSLYEEKDRWPTAHAKCSSEKKVGKWLAHTKRRHHKPGTRYSEDKQPN